MQIPNSLVFMILILASIGLGRVAFHCGRLVRAVLRDPEIRFKPNDDQELFRGFQDDADRIW